ncbi:sulfotransferase family protein [Rugosimonospora acidiphila]|uniref:Sulfotransferase family protein n=1 Tax=Rugosimonospora acidiphila TaxID=556531 RepID=A0ABP9RU89_9ACTN
MQAALERLGFTPCHHMAEVITNPRQMPLWQEALAKPAMDPRRVFEGYRASVDFPGCVFWREQLEAWPEAKVVLTVRDPRRWYASAKQTIFAGPESMPRPEEPDPEMAAFGGFLFGELLPRIFDFGGKQPLNEMDEDSAVQVFNQHIAEVKAIVPAEQLLVFQVSEGWGPLCDFLGVPVPAEEFPHVNESDGFAEVRLGLLAERQRALAAERANSGRTGA